jgi:hypothetical protein
VETITLPLTLNLQSLLIRFLENKLDIHNFRVIMVGHFNTPAFDWKRGLL